jgi:hypothetical protein
VIRNLGLSAEISRKVHQNRLLQLAREGGQAAVNLRNMRAIAAMRRLSHSLSKLRRH